MCYPKYLQICELSNTSRVLADIRARKCVCFVANGKKILVDPGIRKWYRHVTSTFAEVDEIWLTHYHPDHAWAAGLYAKHYDCPVYGPAIDHEILAKPDLFLQREIEAADGFRDQLFNPHFTPYASRIMRVFYGKPYPIQGNVFKEDSRYGVEIKYLQGHTLEEANFLLEVDEKRTLVAGDLLQLRNGEPHLPLNLPKSNLDAALKSLDQLEQLELDVLIPGHGSVVRGKEKIQELIQRARLKYQDYCKRVQDYVLEVNGTPSLRELAIKVDLNYPPKYGESFLERKVHALCAWKAQTVREFV